VDAFRLGGAPGSVYGTTVLDSGDAFELAPRSLIATTVNAYCVP
jgi:hypothetical protein